MIPLAEMITKSSKQTMNKIAICALALSMSLAFSACSDNEDIVLKKAPGNPKGELFQSSLINAEAPDAVMTTLSKDKPSLTLSLQLPKMEDERTPRVSTDKLEDIVVKYTEFKKLKSTDYTLLPSSHYTISATPIAAGSTSSSVTVELKDYESLKYGMYLLPVVIKEGGKEYVHLVNVNKLGEYSALSDTNKKPLPPNSSRTTPMKMVAFVETNDVDPRNLANFVLKDSKKPVFDIVVFFAANMNYDAVAGRRYLSFNDKLQPIVNNPDMYIKYLTDRGIKVIIDILPNHQGVGYRNFQSYEDALTFAQELKVWTDKLGIDGWDMDEEYAQYDLQPHLELKFESGLWYMQAMKAVMPDKLLTLYEFAFPSGRDYNKYVDYSWSDYGVTTKSRYGISNEKYFANSVEASKYGLSTSVSAQYNLSSGFAGQMIFNIPARRIKTDAAQRLSETTRIFYNEDTVFEGPYFVGPKGE